MELNDKIKLVFVFTSCKRSGPIQVMLDVVKNIDKTIFSMYLVTLYEEIEGESKLYEFIDVGVEHVKCQMSKMDILSGRTSRLRNLLNDIDPDVVHSLGVFPDYVISKLYGNKQVITLHNFMREDFIGKYGVIKGILLEYIQMSAVKRAKKVITCSKSLSNKYISEKHLVFNSIQNGINIDEFGVPEKKLKLKMRKALNLATDKMIVVYSGQMIARKNQQFLLKVVSEHFDDIYLLLLGGGTMLAELSAKYKNYENIDFRGNVDNVKDYLKACDVYISTSKSEGMPIGVLEAMASGLPVILSDIPQHCEIMEKNSGIGFVYRQEDENDLEDKIRKIISEDYLYMGKKAYETVLLKFSSIKMSNEYQILYKEMVANRL